MISSAPWLRSLKDANTNPETVTEALLTHVDWMRGGR